MEIRIVEYDQHAQGLSRIPQIYLSVSRKQQQVQNGDLEYIIENVVWNLN
jgi:hypothetical protein